jgi:hypothetical protein
MLQEQTAHPRLATNGSVAMPTTTRTRKPREDAFTLLRRPISPCEMVPAGIPGAVEINGDVYTLGYNATCPEQGDVVIHGYRLTKGGGTVYDLPEDLSECECLGHLRWSQERGIRCKHRRCLEELKANGEIA